MWKISFMIGGKGMNDEFGWLLIPLVLFGLVVSLNFFFAPPQPPTNLTAVVLTKGVFLSWQGSQGNFVVYRSNDGKNFSEIGETRSKNYTDKTVVPGNSYYYTVKCKSYLTESPKSNIVHVSIPLPKPATPVLKIDSTSATSIKLSWKETSKIGFFKLYRSLNSVDFVLVKKIPGSVSVFEDMNLHENTTYFYKLEAFNRGGKSTSKIVKGKTKYDISGYVYRENGKGFSDVEVKLVGTNRKVLTNDEGFWSFKSVSGKVNVKPVMKRSSFTPSEITCNGPRNDLNFIAHFIDNPPNIPSVVAPTNGLKGASVHAIILKWTDSDPDGDTLKYDIYFGKKENPPLLVSNYASTSYKLKNLNYMTKYYWKIVARDPYNESSVSPVWSFTTSSYNLSGIVLYNGTGLKDVEINFGNEATPVYTKENGYWMKEGLSGTVVVTPSMFNWYFKPGSVVVDKDSKNVNFSAFPVEKLKKWHVQIGKVYFSSPAIGEDGTIYVGSLDGKLYAIDKSGDFLWSFPTNYWVRTSPCIAKNGTVYFVSDSDYLYALEASGGLEWKFLIHGYVIGDPSIRNGVVYVGTQNGYLYSVKNGKELWEKKLNGRIDMSPSIDKNGILYVGTSNGVLYAVDTNGKTIWKASLSGPLFSSPAIGQNGFIYVATIAPKDGEVYCVNSENGEIKWSKNIEGEIYASPVIGKDGTVYIASTKGILYAVKNGKIVWKSLRMDGRIISTPVIAKNGKIYVGTQKGILYCVNTSDGALAWSLKLKGGIYSSLSLTSNGTLYIATMGSVLYAIQTNSMGIAGQWPKYKLDLMNSSNVH